MATVTLTLPVSGAQPVAGATLPDFKQAGSSLTVDSYSFDAAADEAIQWQLPKLPNYGSGNLTIKLLWYGDTATSGDVVWCAQTASITPDTDSQDAETKTYGTMNTVTDSHIGTTAQRIHTCSITLSNLDSLAAGDVTWLKVYRDADNGSDTMAGDAQLVGVVVEYSDS
jgi:hypothetical protein